MIDQQPWFWIRRRAAAVIIGVTLATGMLSAGSDPAVLGDWQGTVAWFSPENGTRQLQVVVHLSQTADGTLAGTLGLPDMGPDTLALRAVTYKPPVLHFEFQLDAGASKGQGQGAAGGPPATYDGTMNKDNATITGDVDSKAGKMALVLKRVT